MKRFLKRHCRFSFSRDLKMNISIPINHINQIKMFSYLVNCSSNICTKNSYRTLKSNTNIIANPSLCMSDILTLPLDMLQNPLILPSEFCFMSSITSSITSSTSSITSSTSSITSSMHLCMICACLCKCYNI